MSITIAARRPPAAHPSPWRTFLLGRLVGLVGVLAALVVGTFLIIQLVPGDPARLIAGADASPQVIEQVRHEKGLDRPLLSQFGTYVAGLARGDLGESWVSGQQVTHIIAARLPFTAEVALLGIVLTLLVSVPLGMAVAVACRGGRRGWLDTLFSGTTAIAAAIPEYVLATLLVVVLAIQLGWLDAAGGGYQALVMMVIAVSVGPICTLARIVRRETATVLAQDYMRTARGRRLGALRLYARHALPNLLTSTLTLGGLILTSMLGGAIVIELVFAWPGLGLGILDAIAKRDYPVIQGVVLVLGLLATLLTLLVDVVLGLIDSRTLDGKAAQS